MTAYWDWLSVILYCLMGLLGLVCFAQGFKSKKQGHFKNSRRWYTIWFVSWVLLASFRYVTYGIGGTDAITYITFFEDIDSGHLSSYYRHYDLGFYIFTNCVKLFTSNYHVYMIIFYSILVYAYIKFVDEFSIKSGIYSSYFLIFFLFLRGFTSLRTNLSDAFILLGLIDLKNDRKYRSLIFMLIACSMHKAAIIFAGIYIFYFINQKKPISIRAGILFAMISAAVGFIAQSYIGFYFDSSVDAYASYALRSVGISFFDNFWKIAFGQLVLIVMMLLFNSKIRNFIMFLDEHDSRIVSCLRIFCFYDFILIPLEFVLGVWRGCEYLYIPRLAMWGIIWYFIFDFTCKRRKMMIYFFSLFLFIIWFIFRLARTYEDSSLLPYLFGPFIS